MGLILLVEDEPGAVAVMRRYIEKDFFEHKLAAFAKAAEALSYAVQNKVDLFILDIQLLDYRGTELARQLRSMPEYRFTPILLLLILFRFDFSAMLRWLPVTVGAVGLLAVFDGIAMLLRQHRVQAQQKAVMLEQYLPLVEELIEQVRARQHDFNNQMMAVAAAVSTARDLQEAQDTVTSLLQHVRLDGADKQLLKCDSKVISGLLFGKMKQAELKCIRVEVTIAGAFLRRALSEASWVELIAILLDNAMEAASPGDVLYARAAEETDGLRFSVLNPHPALSNMEFIQMFQRGWSTKKETGHGYGLYNVRQIVERHGGKIITGNDQLNGIPYISIGVLIS